MKRLLKGIFGRSATAPALLPPGSGAGPVAASNVSVEPQTAKFGTSCTSHAFLTVQDHIEWYAGHQGEDGTWSIRKVTEMPNVSGRAVPVGEPVHKTTTQQTGLSFFEAIKILAAYEQGQLALHVVPVDLDDAVIKSGQMHYTPFAEREGIVFDTSGTPYPTVNGEVVGDGIFTKAALDRVRAVQAQNSAYFLQGSNNFIDALINPLKDSSDNFDRAIKNRLNVSHLKDVIIRVEQLAMLIDYGFFTPVYLRSTPNMMILHRRSLDDIALKNFGCEYYDYDDDESHYNMGAVQKLRTVLSHGPEENFPAAMSRIAGDIRDIVPKLDMDDAYKQGLLANVAAMVLFFEISAQRYNADYGYQDEAPHRQACVALQDAAPSFESGFQELGGTPETLWKIKSFMIETASVNGMAKKPPAIDAFIKELQTMRNDLMDLGDRTEKQIVAGPHISSGTVSRGPG
jgi:hypothetical protein